MAFVYLNPEQGNWCLELEICDMYEPVFFFFLFSTGSALRTIEINFMF